MDRQKIKILESIDEVSDFRSMVKMFEGATETSLESKTLRDSMNRRSPQLVKYDRIVVGEKVDMITAWESENKVMSNFEPAFPLQQAVIDYFPATELFFTLGEHHAEFELYVSGDHELSFQLNPDGNFHPTWVSSNIRTLEKIGKVSVDSMVSTCAYVFASVSAFLLYYEDSDFVSVTRERRNATKKGKKGKGKRNVVRLMKRYEIVSTPRSEAPKRTIERHTEGWTVRGHWRHYKNGKTVWVSPYQKGDLRKVQPKTYQI